MIKIRLTICVMFITFSISAQSLFHQRLADSAMTLINRSIRYDANYYTIAYPNGDVPPNTGVCSDVVIRVYRKLGIDLQKEVHEDMKANFATYPNKWGLRRTDRSIDHRRVPNLMRFFERKQASLPLTDHPANYLPGDIVSWDLKDGRPHIGIVVNRKSRCGTRYLIVHNIGGGQQLDDCLFRYKITGHYRYKK